MPPSSETDETLPVAAAFRHVGITYGRRQVLNDVDVEVHRGVTFLVGQNGVGKTSLFRVLLGTLKPSSGRVELAGVEMTRGSRQELVARIGYLPQNFTAPGPMRVLDFLRYVAWLRGVTGSEQIQAARRALDLVGLADRSLDRIGILSGGMVRRVGVAQALVHNPAVLLLDEPTAGLDPGARVALRRLIADLATDRTVLCNTHLLEDAALSGGVLVALHDGRVAFNGATSVLAAKAADRTPAGMSDLEYAFMRLVTDQADQAAR